MCLKCVFFFSFLFSSFFFLCFVFLFCFCCLVLRLSETAREKARGNYIGPSHVPSKRKDEIKSGTLAVARLLFLTSNLQLPSTVYIYKKTLVCLTSAPSCLSPSLLPSSLVVCPLLCFLLLWLSVPFFASFFFGCLSPSLLPSSLVVCLSSYTRGRHLLSKTLVHYCFLVFRRIGECISFP